MLILFIYIRLAFSIVIHPWFARDNHSGMMMITFCGAWVQQKICGVWVHQKNNV
jgi:hypothetical protein